MNDSLEQLVRAVSAATGPLSTLLSIFTALAGATFIAIGLFALQKRSELGRQGGSWAGPASWMICGVILWAFPASLRVISASIFSAGDVPAAQAIFSWAPNTVATLSDGVARETLEAIIRVLQFFGLLAVIRGVFIVNASMQPSMGGQRTFGAGLTHIIGGILAVQIPRVAGVIENLLT